MPTLTFDAGNVLEVPAGPTGRATYYDGGRGGVDGLVLRVGGRSRTYFACGRLRGRVVWVRIGPASSVRLKDARKAARVYLGQLAAGVDPNAQSRRSKAARTGRRRALVARGRGSVSVAKLVLAYISARERSLSARTMVNYSRTYRAVLHGSTLGRARASSVVRSDVREFLAGVSRRTSVHVADQLLALLRAAYRWGNVEEAAPGRALVDRDPTRGLEAFAARTRRTGSLDDASIPAFWRGTGTLDVDRRVFARLLLLLGLRRGEAHVARWRDVNLDARVWRVPVENRKVRVSVRAEVGDLLVPLPPVAVEMLRELRAAHPTRETLFRFSVGYVGGEIQAAAGMPKLLLHDLRRACAQGLERLGAPPHVIALALGHTGKLPGQVASDLHYVAQLRPAEVRLWLERWAAHVLQLVAAAPAG